VVIFLPLQIYKADLELVYLNKKESEQSTWYLDSLPIQQKADPRYPYNRHFNIKCIEYRGEEDIPNDFLEIKTYK